jgi:hypothetical protein
MNHLKKGQNERSMHAFNEYNTETMKNMLIWCQENCKGHWFILNSIQICLYDDNDAMFFKLTWLK